MREREQLCIKYKRMIPLRLVVSCKVTVGVDGKTDRTVVSFCRTAVSSCESDRELEAQSLINPGGARAVQ